MGKSHDFVVDLLGVLASDHGQAYHGVLVDTDQAARLPHPAALLEMVEHGQCLVVGQLAAIQSGAFAFAKAELAGAAGQDTAVLVGAVAEADAQIGKTPLTVVRALRVLAAEDFQVVHGAALTKGVGKVVFVPQSS
jgi:hypothetical protein